MTKAGLGMRAIPGKGARWSAWGSPTTISARASRSNPHYTATVSSSSTKFFSSN